MERKERERMNEEDKQGHILAYHGLSELVQKTKTCITSITLELDRSTSILEGVRRRKHEIQQEKQRARLQLSNLSSQYNQLKVRLQNLELRLDHVLS